MTSPQPPLIALLPKIIAAAEEAGTAIHRQFTRNDIADTGDFTDTLSTELETQLRARLLALLPGHWFGLERQITADESEPYCWAVAPHDGELAFAQGERGSSVSIALLRNGVPVLGVVHAPLSPDCGADTIAWVEGLPHLLRNGVPVVATAADREISKSDIVFVTRHTPDMGIGSPSTFAPARPFAVASFAYALARVAAGDAAAAVCPTGAMRVNYAAGHALLKGAGKAFVGAKDKEIDYETNGGGFALWSLGGTRQIVATLAARVSDLRHLVPHTPPRRTALTAPRRGNDIMLDRAVGCLLGQVAGDSLGALVEFEDAHAIARRYPDGVRDLAEGGPFHTLAGQPTDDSELALALARTLAGRTDWPSEAVATAYGDWYGSGPFDCGGTTRRAFRPIHATADRKAAAAIAAADKTSQSNGALMRCAPIGIWAQNATEAAELARLDAVLSHPHPVCLGASAAYAAAIATGVAGGSVAAMLEAAKLAIPERGTTPLRDSLTAALNGELPKDFMTLQGWVLIAFQNAFYHLAAGIPLEEAVIATVGCGGDTDTNAAICGALLGAAQGRCAVPVRWRLSVLSCQTGPESGARHPRPASFWPDDLVELAEALLARH